MELKNFCITICIVCSLICTINVSFVIIENIIQTQPNQINIENLSENEIAMGEKYKLIDLE